MDRSAAPVVDEVRNMVTVVDLKRRNALRMRPQIIVEVKSLLKYRWIVRTLKIKALVNHPPLIVFW